MSLRININSVRSVLDNLHDVSDRKLKAALAALIEGGLKIKGDSVKITPLDLSNLRGSAYVIWEGGGNFSTAFVGDIAPRLLKEQGKVKSEQKKRIRGHKAKHRILVIVGHTAYYALYVHEMVGANFRAPGTQAKYLATSFRRNAGNIKKLVMSKMKAA